MGQFDPSKLKPGDEVGITWKTSCGTCVFTAHVTAIDDQGMIEVEGRESPFWPDDGREVELIINGEVHSSGVRLCEPTDEGRANSLREDLGYDLDTLSDGLHDLTLDELRQFDAEVKALQAKYGARAVIDVPVVERVRAALKGATE